MTNELTEAERKALNYNLAPPWGEWYEGLYAAVARIKADAHAAGVAEGRAEGAARVEALADEWERTAPLCSDEEESVRCLLVRELRAALAGTSPQGEGE